MPYFESQGARLFYESQGAGGPPLVFVHGFGCTHEDWQSQVDFFNTGHQVVTCDLRGHGASDRDPANCDIVTFGADVGALLHELDLQRVVLVGHSMGCRVAVQASRSASPRLAGVILIDGSRGGAGDPEAVEQQAQQNLRDTGYAATVHRLFAEMFLEGCDPKLRDRLISQAEAFPEEVDAELVRVPLQPWEHHTLA
ncbi:MAG: hypothetical protein BZY88_15180 [SAR202 cluster bacterium Io17-Chloro-G9]|nr:MAG: hypothetical protein BZY88_15180 [SAR202 cluster bacterium Io17-Chloro-G9]